MSLFNIVSVMTQLFRNCTLVSICLSFLRLSEKNADMSQIINCSWAITKNQPFKITNVYTVGTGCVTQRMPSLTVKLSNDCVIDPTGVSGTENRKRLMRCEKHLIGRHETPSSVEKKEKKASCDNRRRLQNNQQQQHVAANTTSITQ